MLVRFLYSRANHSYPGPYIELQEIRYGFAAVVSLYINRRSLFVAAWGRRQRYRKKVSGLMLARSRDFIWVIGFALAQSHELWTREGELAGRQDRCQCQDQAAYFEVRVYLLALFFFLSSLL